MIIISIFINNIGYIIKDNYLKDEFKIQLKNKIKIILLNKLKLILDINKNRYNI